MCCAGVTLSPPAGEVSAWQERVLATDMWLREADVMGGLEAGVRSEHQWGQWCDFVAPLVSPHPHRVGSPQSNL